MSTPGLAAKPLSLGIVEARELQIHRVPGSGNLNLEITFRQPPCRDATGTPNRGHPKRAIEPEAPGTRCHVADDLRALPHRLIAV